jgi:hypothetical protein
VGSGLDTWSFLHEENRLNTEAVTLRRAEVEVTEAFFEEVMCQPEG